MRLILPWLGSGSGLVNWPSVDWAGLVRSEVLGRRPSGLRFLPCYPDNHRFEILKA